MKYWDLGWNIGIWWNIGIYCGYHKDDIQNLRSSSFSESSAALRWSIWLCRTRDWFNFLFLHLVIFVYILPCKYNHSTFVFWLLFTWVLNYDEILGSIVKYWDIWWNIWIYDEKLESMMKYWDLRWHIGMY